MSVFRAYDIRGLYPQEVNEELAYKVGLAFGELISGTIAVGYDVRTSSPSLRDKLIAGLTDAGLNVVTIGMVSTPMLYFSVPHYGFDGGIMISASHNPKQYNGFKFVGKGGIVLSYDTGIDKLERLAQNPPAPKEQKGSVTERNVTQEYITEVLKKIPIKKQLKVVIDAGNGAACEIAPKLFEQAGHTIVPLYCEPDGNFPHHQADPIQKKTLVDLQKKVVQEGADLGIAFDGDADRVGFVDEKGNCVDDYHTFTLLASKVLEKRPGAKIIFEVLASRVVEDMIKKLGGVPLVSRVGHSYIQHTLLEEKCAFAGEISGHYYYEENFGFDDGVFAALKMTEVLTEKPLSELTSALPRYITADEERIEVPDEKKFAVIEKLKELVKDKHEVLDIDGVKVLFEDGWFIARPSNTQPAISFRFEATNQEAFKRIESLARGYLEEAMKL